MSLGYGWQPLADALGDLLLYAFWFLAGGAVAIGACWYGGYECYRAWRELEHESLRRRHERRIDSSFDLATTSQQNVAECDSAN